MSGLPGYDAWKLATPPEYDELGSDPAKAYDEGYAAGYTAGFRDGYETLAELIKHLLSQPIPELPAGPDDEVAF